ncbi:hypothetical protein, partial [Rhodopseudomonas sp. B29]|uniref:hypothetical protein n=1 Tax=Rhodopseudomonas sp. B29 TaxID=95607 RepID=UPI001AEC287A
NMLGVMLMELRNDLTVGEPRFTRAALVEDRHKVTRTSAKETKRAGKPQQAKMQKLKVKDR